MEPISSRAVKVAELVITQTGTYNEQFHRPWQVSATEDAVASLYENINERGLTINNKLFTGNNSAIIKPAGSADTKIKIPNGWEEERARFQLVLEVTSTTGLRFYQVVRGFTDYHGVSVRGERASFDDDMRFYINSITNIKPRRVHGRVENVIEDVSQLLYSIGDGNTPSYYSRDTHEERLRPEDLFTHISRSSFDRELLSANAYDETTINNETPVKANMSFSLPGTYASKVLSSFQSAARNMQFGASQEDILMDAINTSMEASIMNDTFMSVVRNEARTSQAYFTLRNLARIDPNHPRPTYSEYNERDRSLMSRHGRSSSWGAGTLEATAAVQIVQGVPAIMSRYGIIYAQFCCQNLRTRSFTGGEREWLNTPGRYMTAKGMSGSEASHRDYLQMIDMIVEEVIEPLTENGLFDIDVDITCDLSGDTSVELSIDGGPEELFVQPTFASALLSPLVTGNRNHAMAMASDFNALTDHLFELGDVGGEDIYVGDDTNAHTREDRPLLLGSDVQQTPKRQNSGLSGEFASREGSFAERRFGTRDQDDERDNRGFRGGRRSGGV